MESEIKFLKVGLTLDMVPGLNTLLYAQNDNDSLFRYLRWRTRYMNEYNRPKHAT